MEVIDFATLAHRLASQPKNTRLLVAVAGPPGSGKSTFAQQLVGRLNRSDPGRAAVLPMDGYHYDDGLLKELGRLSRKGAPDTFDVDGLRHMLVRLRDKTESAVAVPVFDRDIEIARAGARLIPASTDIVVVEGNYLLLRQPPWAGLRPFFDLAILVEVSEEILRQRLTARWQHHGLPPERISRKLEGDISNGRLVRNESVNADCQITNWQCGE
ncbi:hypothetical protein [Microvirga sp. 2TAF3]|uniref:hypothetical protein n=1 Tax=Microvirga sp. 2TAF3 TaxID=3233014 RepID=UPI003F9EAE5C